MVEYRIKANRHKMNWTIVIGEEKVRQGVSVRIGMRKALAGCLVPAASSYISARPYS